MPRRAGPRALIVAPDGSAALVTMPAEPAALAAAVNAAVGGHFGAPVGGDDWVAYTNADPGPGAYANPLAALIAARLAGPMAGMMIPLIGPVVFLGRSGSTETDIPARMLKLADPGARPSPPARRPDMRLRFRLYVDGEVADEHWFGVPGGEPADGAVVADRHRVLVDAAEQAGKPWRIEVFDPTAPDGEQYYGFGTDSAGMMHPMAVIPGPPGYPPQSAN